MCSIISESVNEIKCKLNKLNELKSLCKSLDKIQCILNLNNSVLCEAIECENNDYLDMNLNIGLNLCKISDKMLSNHLTRHLRAYYSTHCDSKPFKCLFQNCFKQFKSKSGLNTHKLIHNKSVEYLSCFWPKCQFKTKIQSELTRHQLMHSEIKQFKCNY